MIVLISFLLLNNSRARKSIDNFNAPRSETVLIYFALNHSRNSTCVIGGEIVEQLTFDLQFGALVQIWMPSRNSIILNFV